MDHRSARLFGQRLWQPFDQPLHFGHRLGFGEPVLLGPAINLPPEIIAGFAEVGQPRRLDIDIVECRQRVDHRFISKTAFGRVRTGHCAVPDCPALDHVHDVEPAADDAIVGAQAVRLGDRKAGRVEARNNLIFAVHRMCARQQHAQRLATENIRTAFGIQPVGRVRLATGELQRLDRAFKTGNIGGHPLGEFCLVNLVGAGRGDCAGKGRLGVDGVGHKILSILQKWEGGAPEA